MAGRAKLALLVLVSQLANRALAFYNQSNIPNIDFSTFASTDTQNVIREGANTYAAIQQFP